MKTIGGNRLSLLSMAMVLLLTQTILGQNTWVVSNDPSFGAADFTTIQTAIDSASAGDKIYVHGSPIPYATFTLAKKLHLIGSGFWKIENSIPDENLNISYIDALVIMVAGSDSSIFEGFTLNRLRLNDCDNMIIRYNFFNSANSNHKLEFIGSPVNTMLYGNYFQIYGTLTGSAISANIFNNIILGNNYQNRFWQDNDGCIECLLQNNAFAYTLDFILFTNCTLRNNIVASGDARTSNCILENNIFADDEVTVNEIPIDSLGNENIDSVDINTIWNLANPSPDGKYQLIGDSTTNVAIGAGVNGEDCGAFGGNSPYRLSGIVKVPTIYQMLIPLLGDTTNMLNVKIRAKSN